MNLHRLGRILLATSMLPAVAVIGMQSAHASHVPPTVRDVNMANLASNERETHIVVDPNNPNHIAAGANWRGSGQIWYVSTDGGRTWTNGTLPYGTLQEGNGPGVGFGLMSDPSLGFGAGGRIYFSALAHGGATDACDLFVTSSTDNGANWSDPGTGVIADAGTTSVCNDKEHILIDPSNENIYVAWTPVGGTNGGKLFFSRDLGGAPNGYSVSAPITLSTAASQSTCFNHGAELAQQADGDLYVSWTTFCNGVGEGADSSVWVARSHDRGLTWGAPVQVATLDNFNPTDISAAFRSRTFPSIDADAATGRLFVVWTDYVDMDGGDADILMSSSSDDGATWGAAQGVDQETDNGDDQFQPWVDVANGRVHVAFFGYDEEADSFDTYVSYGNVAATPTMTAVKVSSQSTPATTGFIGDYLAIDVGSDDVAHPTWSDGRPGTGGSTDAHSARLDFSPPSLVTLTKTPATTFWGDNVTVRATVAGAHDESEQFIPVKFTVTSGGTPSPTSGTATTNAAGVASFTYTNGKAGIDTVSAWVDLDEDGINDVGEVSMISVTWRMHPTQIYYVGPTTGSYHLPLTLKGLLGDFWTFSVIPGETITLGFGTETCTGVTDANGEATCTLTPEQTPGPYQAFASYAGSSQYLPSDSDPVDFTLQKRATTLALNGPSNVANGYPATLKATLSEDMGGPGIAGRTVNLTLGTGAFSQSCSGVTNASGQAQCTIASVAQPATATTAALSASFAGDAFYLPSSANATAKLLYYTGRASGMIAKTVTLFGTHLKRFADTGAISTSVPSTKTASSLSVNAGVLKANWISGTVTTGQGTSTATATIASAQIAVSGLPLIVVTGVRATSVSACNVANFTAGAAGGTTIASLRIGGVVVPVTAAPNQVINLGVAKLIINQQLPVPGSSAGMTVNAVRLIAARQDLILASATSDVHNCP